MNLGQAIRLKSAIFKEAVRLPGSGTTAHYIPSDDYPLAYYPEIRIVEARCRKGTTPMPGQDPVRWYDSGSTRDMTPDPSAFEGGPDITERAGVLVAPDARMRQLPGGGWERMTSDEESPVVGVDLGTDEEPAPASSAPKRPRGRPRKVAQVKAEKGDGAT